MPRRSQPDEAPSRWSAACRPRTGCVVASLRSSRMAAMLSAAAAQAALRLAQARAPPTWARTAATHGPRRNRRRVPRLCGIPQFAKSISRGFRISGPRSIRRHRRQTPLGCPTPTLLLRSIRTTHPTTPHPPVGVAVPGEILPRRRRSHPNAPMPGRRQACRSPTGSSVDSRSHGVVADGQRRDATITAGHATKPQSSSIPAGSVRAPSRSSGVRRQVHPQILRVSEMLRSAPRSARRPTAIENLHQSPSDRTLISELDRLERDRTPTGRSAKRTPKRRWLKGGLPADRSGDDGFVIGWGNPPAGQALLSRGRSALPVPASPSFWWHHSSAAANLRRLCIRSRWSRMPSATT